MSDAVTVTDDFIWKPEDVQPGVKVGTYRASEVWMIAYETSGRDGRLALVSLSDGMIAHRHKTRAELAQMFNEDRRPHVAALATQPQDHEVVDMDDPKADEATHAHIGDDVDAVRWSAIRKELAKNQEYRERIAQLEVERELTIASHNTMAEERDQTAAREEQLQEVLEHLIHARDRADYAAVNRLCDEVRKALSLTPPQALSKRDGEVLALRKLLEQASTVTNRAFLEACHLNNNDDDLATKNAAFVEQWLVQVNAALTASTQAAQDAEDAIRADERERCAQVCSDKADEYHAKYKQAMWEGKTRNAERFDDLSAQWQRPATAIRNRSTKGEG